jgi:hypothetical protein
MFLSHLVHKQCNSLSLAPSPWLSVPTTEPPPVLVRVGEPLGLESLPPSASLFLSTAVLSSLLQIFEREKKTSKILPEKLSQSACYDDPLPRTIAR